MSDLTDFLLARIAEDEAVARAASALSRWDDEAKDYVLVPGQPATWVSGDGYGGGAVERTNGDRHDVGIVVYDEGSPNEREAAQIARHDPARVLAECEAKRQIVEECAKFRGVADATAADAPLAQALAQAGVVQGLERAVHLLASVYADHPDYRPEWRP